MGKKRWLVHEDNPIECKDQGNLVSRDQVLKCRRYLFRVHSPAEFPDIKYRGSEDMRFDNRANREFYARLYQPESATTDTVIIYNGLDETVFQLDEEALFGFYDRLGESLANNGIQAILLPTPYHLNRAMCYADHDRETEWRDSNREAADDYLVPTNALIRSPGNIYQNHFWGYLETRAVVDVLRRNTNSGIVSEEVATELTKRLAPNAEVSLIGYSLGGLRALTEFVHDRVSNNDGEPTFASCVVLSSGGALSDLPPPYWVDAEKWSQMISDMMTLPEATIEMVDRVGKHSELAKEHFSILEDVFLGKARSFQKLERADPLATLDVLFMVGGGDDLVPLSSLQRFAPRGGINVLQISQLGHMYRYGALRRWETAVSSLVTDFIRATSETRRTQSYPQRYADTVAIVDHALTGQRILPYDADLECRETIDSAVSRLRQQDSQDIIVEAVLGTYANDLGEASCKDFVAYLIHALQTLARMVRDRECHPAIYKKARRKTLFGWYASRNSGLVDQWKDLVGDEELLGDKLVQLCVISPEQRESALLVQARDLARLRASIARDARIWIKSRLKS